MSGGSRMLQKVLGGAVLALAAVVGWMAHTPRAVQAQTRGSRDGAASADLQDVRLSGNGPQAVLSVYSPADRTLYVYESVTAGGSHVSCSFMLRMGRPGAAIDRQNCAPGTLVP